MPSLMESVVTLDIGAQEPWPNDVKLFQPYAMEQILLPDNANCLAVQAFLHMCGLPFQIEHRSNAEFMSPSGKVPFIKCGAFVVSELEPIVQFIANKGITLTEELTPEQKSDMRAYMSIIYTVLMNAELYICWCDNRTYNEVTKVRNGSVYPWPLNIFQTWSKRSAVNRKLKVLGWYKKTLESVYQEVENCCQALSERLNGKEYFFGSNPTELDACMYGHIFAILSSPEFSTDLISIIMKYPNLILHCKRICINYVKSTSLNFSELLNLPEVMSGNKSSNTNNVKSQSQVTTGARCLQYLYSNSDLSLCTLVSSQETTTNVALKRTSSLTNCSTCKSSNELKNQSVSKSDHDYLRKLFLSNYSPHPRTEVKFINLKTKNSSITLSSTSTSDGECKDYISLGTSKENQDLKRKVCGKNKNVNMRKIGAINLSLSSSSSFENINVKGSGDNQNLSNEENQNINSKDSGTNEKNNLSLTSFNSSENINIKRFGNNQHVPSSRENQNLNSKNFGINSFVNNKNFGPINLSLTSSSSYENINAKGSGDNQHLPSYEENQDFDTNKYLKTNLSSISSSSVEILNAKSSGYNQNPKQSEKILSLSSASSKSNENLNLKSAGANQNLFLTRDNSMKTLNETRLMNQNLNNKISDINKNLTFINSTEKLKNYEDSDTDQDSDENKDLSKKNSEINIDFTLPHSVEILNTSEDSEKNQNLNKKNSEILPLSNSGETFNTSENSVEIMKTFKESDEDQDLNKKNSEIYLSVPLPNSFDTFKTSKDSVVDQDLNKKNSEIYLNVPLPNSFDTFKTSKDSVVDQDLNKKNSEIYLNVPLPNSFDTFKTSEDSDTDQDLNKKNSELYKYLPLPSSVETLKFSENSEESIKLKSKDSDQNLNRLKSNLSSTSSCTKKSLKDNKMRNLKPNNSGIKNTLSKTSSSKNKYMSVNDIDKKQNLNRKDAEIKRNLNKTASNIQEHLNINDVGKNKNLNQKYLAIQNNLNKTSATVNESLNLNNVGKNKKLNQKHSEVKNNLNITGCNINESVNGNIVDKNQNLNQENLGTKNNLNKKLSVKNIKNRNFCTKNSGIGRKSNLSRPSTGDSVSEKLANNNEVLTSRNSGLIENVTPSSSLDDFMDTNDYENQNLSGTSSDDTVYTETTYQNLIYKISEESQFLSSDDNQNLCTRSSGALNTLNSKMKKEF